MVEQTSAQRWYAVEYHRHGKGNWKRHYAAFPARILAEACARGIGAVTPEEAINASRQLVFRVVATDTGKVVRHG